MVAPTKEKKVAIDSRFKGMFKDKKFNVIAKVDKYGRKVNKKDEYALQNYYQASGSEHESDDGDADDSSGSKRAEGSKMEESDSDAVGKKYYDSDGKFKW